MKKKVKTIYEITITDKRKASIFDKTIKTKKEFAFKAQAAWKLKKYLEKNKLINIKWDRTQFILKKQIINDYDYISEPYDKKKLTIKVEEKNMPLTINQRVYILQHEHTTGRWGQNIADADINHTKDYVILNCYEHEIDYMFSESVRSYYWIYNINTMKEFKVENNLTYRYLHNSSGIKETGVDSVRFSNNNPYLILVKLSDLYGENKEIITIDLPQ